MDITLENVKTFSRGAAFLGSGGGGDVDEFSHIAQKALETYGPVPVLPVEEIRNEDWVIALELIGAPIPKNKRTCYTPQILPLLKRIREDFSPLNIRALIPVEIGGSNALTPLCVAGEVGLPLCDGDLLGRAFPEISMISPNLFHLMPKHTYIGDPQTGEVRRLHCTSYENLEQQGRRQTINHQNHIAVLVPTILSGNEARTVVVSGTISQALQIGAQQSIQDLCRVTQGTVQFEGEVLAWRPQLREGFLWGTLVIQDHAGKIFKIWVKNEYLILAHQGKRIAEIPDIITLIDLQTFQPLLSDQIQVGQKIACLTCRGPALWYTKKGLQLTRQPFAQITLCEEKSGRAVN